MKTDFLTSSSLKENEMNSRFPLKRSVVSAITNTLMVLTAISLITACSPKPSAEESATQTKLVVEQAVAEAKKEMIAEKDQQDAASAAQAEAKAKQDAAVEQAVANERNKNAAAQRAANAKHERRAEQRASAARTENYSSNSANRNTCNACGVVQSVKEIETAGTGSGLGVVAGGVVGGVMGNQVGAGRGRDLATIAGALGGAYAGNTIEKNTKKTISYRIEVKMDSGEDRTFNQDHAPDVASGDRVKIENNAVVRR